MLGKMHFKKTPNRLEGEATAKAEAAPQVPNRLYAKCDQCGQMLPSGELVAAQYVCTKCGYHFRISARRRLSLVCDESSFSEWDAGLVGGDPLSFPGYSDKLKSSRQKSRENEGVITGQARVGGCPAAVFAMEAGFMMGSMGSAVGEKVTRCFERATERGLPVVGFTVSGGARMQEGMLSLTQMAKTSGAVQRHGQAGNLYITVLTDPTTGGVTASFAMEGDILLAEPGALIGFAGPRVIEQTIRQKLPKGFQTAEFLLEKGFLDQVVPREQLRGVLSQLLQLHEKEANGCGPL